MRYFCVVVLLAWTVGSAEVFVAGQQSAAGQKGTKPREPLADIPKEFAVLLLSPEQHTREAAKRPTYWEDLWKGLPYDSISLELGRGGACFGVCEVSSTVTLYRATVSGIVFAPVDQSGRVFYRELRGRAELRTLTVISATVPFQQPPAAQISELEPFLPPQPRGTQIRELEGSVDIYTFAKLSYLLHRARFLQLPDRYYCSSCPFEPGYFMLSVAAGGKTKAVIDYPYGYASGDGRLVELWAIQQLLDSLSKSIKWTDVTGKVTVDQQK